MRHLLPTPRAPGSSAARLVPLPAYNYATRFTPQGASQVAQQQAAVKRKIFISYARSDGSALARQLARGLKRLGHEVHFDDAPKPGSVQWGRATEQAIRHCDCQLALLSDGAYASNECRAEQLMFIDAGKPVIPLLVHAKARRPLHLFARHYYDFSDPACLEERLAEVARLLDERGLKAKFRRNQQAPTQHFYRFILQSSIEPQAGPGQEPRRVKRAELKRFSTSARQLAIRGGGSVLPGPAGSLWALFETAAAGLNCARELALEPIEPGSSAPPARIALHAGALRRAGRKYSGPALDRVQRICQACHAGQVLLSGTAAHAATSETAALLDLGAHSLSDLGELEHLYQLDDARFAQREFPPPLTLSQLKHNLPAQPTLFVGRAEELAELEQLLAARRLLTIKAPGGYGKSRLALQLCANLLPRFARGAYFIELAPIDDAALILNQIASATGFQYYGSKEPREQILDFLRDKELLLCFDNFEHVLDGATLLSEILKAAPRVKILATSRAALNLLGEQVYELEPLKMAEPSRPEEAEAGASEAAQLFIDRAAQRRPDWLDKAASLPLIELVCAKLEGIPLALELAAAWSDKFSLPELLAQLAGQLELTARSSDVPPRQHSVRASLDWSWSLLHQDQRRMLMLLSAFRGGFFADAAAYVLGIQGITLRIELGKLADKSWLYTREVDGQMRFYLRDAASHEYVFAKLRATAPAPPPANRQPKPALAQRAENLYELAVLSHARYFSALMEREGPRLHGHGQLEALRILGLEQLNIYEALDTLQNRLPDEEPAKLLVPVAQGLSDFLDRTSEFQVILERFTPLSKPLKQTFASYQLRLCAYLTCGRAYRWLNDYPAARSMLSRARRLANRHADAAGVAAVCFQLGNIAQRQGRYDESRELLMQSLAAFKDLSDTRGMADCYNNLGLLECLEGSFADARAYLSKALSIAKDTGNLSQMASSLMNLGAAEAMQGNFKQAQEILDDALTIRHQTGDRRGISAVLHYKGGVSERQGDLAAARTFTVEALAIQREIGDRSGIGCSLYNLGILDYMHGNYGSAQDAYAEAANIFDEIGESRNRANSLIGMGSLEYVQARYEDGRKHYFDALQVFLEIKERSGVELCYNNLGNSEFKLRNYSTARDYYWKALDLAKSLGAKDGICDISAIAGSLLAHLGILHAAALCMFGSRFHTVQIAYSLDMQEQAILDLGLAILEHPETGLPADARARLKAQAEAMSLDELAQLALSELEKLKEHLAATAAPLNA